MLRRITQVAIVVPDIEEAVEKWSRILGVKPPKIIETEDWSKTRMTFRGHPSNARAKLAFFQFENITLELIQPVGEPSTWSEHLREKGAGLHHIAFHVDNPKEVQGLLEETGGTTVQEGKFEGGGYIYVDSTRSLGAVIEILYSEPRA